MRIERGLIDRAKTRALVFRIAAQCPTRQSVMTDKMQDATAPWRCPVCRGPLSDLGDSLRCDTDQVSFEVIFGIPDLRHPGGENEERRIDLKRARERAAASAGLSPAESITALFAEREGLDGWTPADTRDRARRTLAGPDRFRREVKGWLLPAVSNGIFLDVGCGLGGLLTGAAAEAKSGVGIDNKMELLVLAKQMIESAGGRPVLAAADAEALPLADGSVSGVTMCDVVEHIDDLPSAFSEASRVTKTGGILACAIPNRYSLAPEPHVFIWGVGWMPRRFQIPFVQWRTGKPYAHTRLPSTMEVKRLLRRHSRFRPKMSAAEIPSEEIDAFRGLRAILGRIYNKLVPYRIAQPALVALGPSFQLIAVKE